MKLEASVGITVGIIVGLVIAFALLKAANTNHRMKTDYDERQQLIRGKGYMYAFYTILFYEVLMMIIDIGEFSLPIESYAVHCVGLIIGVIVLGVYCIWNDVYWGLNNNRKRYTAIIVIAIVLNVIPIIRAIGSGEIATSGFDSFPIMNIMVIVWMAIIGLSAVVKKLFVKTEDEEA